MHAPVIAFSKDYTATTSSPTQFPEADAEGDFAGFSFPPTKWALQVTGLTAANALATPSAWDVIVQPSLDLLGFNDMSAPFLEHVNGTNASGDVVFGKIANVFAFPLRAIRVDVKTLTLGATATKIRVSILGVA